MSSGVQQRMGGFVWARRRAPYASNETDPDDFLPPLSRQHINILMTDYEQSLAAGTPLAIAIDECSMLAAQTFGRILRRIQEFEQDYIKTKPPPPRLFILVGLPFTIQFKTLSLPKHSVFQCRRFFSDPSMQGNSNVCHSAG